MSGVALIRNPNSTGNLRSASSAATRAGIPAEIRLIDGSTLDTLSTDLVAAHATGIDLILIDGGDGTVREVLSRLPEIWGAALPRIGILPHGNTNLIAREVGGLQSADAISQLLRRLESGPPLPERQRAILRLDYPAGEHPTLRGFMMGWGAYATGTRIARDEIAARGSGQATLAVLSTLRRALIGAERAALRRGVAAGISIDGGPVARSERLLGLATTLQQSLVAGLNPFWGAGPGPIRWLDIDAPGHRLVLAAPFLALGKPRRWMSRSGYTSGRAARIELELDTPFIMDGEAFPSAASGPMILSAREEITFISL
ncbi:MAG TPA: diacylglycerol kinase family protein [Thermohalobaculum sp.]|nr:diacylglycerol kinase family protein [Thermohalobaculum sp.]